MILSELGLASPANVATGRELFLVLKSYFDGSTKTGAAMTLAAVAADDETWHEFDSAWVEIRTKHGAPYCHMKELMPLQPPFEEWTPLRRDHFLVDIANLLSFFSRKNKFQPITCTIDLAAHQRWEAENHLPSPQELCGRSVFTKLLSWYDSFPSTLIGPIEMMFDRNESFRSAFTKSWYVKDHRRTGVWKIVRAIGAGDQSEFPGLQVADMIAWSRNRLAGSELIQSPVAIKKGYEITDSFSQTAHSILNSCGVYHTFMDEQILATGKFS